jgi:hypothetical protein
MLKGIAWRLGFILVLAVSARLIGGLFSPAHPKNDVEMVEWPGHPGIKIPRTAIETSSLDAPLDDPLMQQALASIPFHGTGSGAKMTYRSSNGPVTLTPDDVAELNSRYHRLKGDAS